MKNGIANFTNGIIGGRFGRLTVLSIEKHEGAHSKVLCKCECGVECLKRIDHLKSGASGSCGCLVAEKLREARERQRNGATTGGRQTPTYQIWAGMRKRCRNPKAQEFKEYGGRGITVCERWDNYENFLADMGERPDGLTIERNDVNGNYEPGNCRWATMTEQNRNKRNVILSESIAAQVRQLFATGLTGAEIARRTGVSSASVSNIIRGKQWKEVV